MALSPDFRLMIFAPLPHILDFMVLPPPQSLDLWFLAPQISFNLSSHGSTIVKQHINLAILANSRKKC